MQINDNLNKLNEHISLKDEKINKKQYSGIKMVKTNKLLLYFFTGIILIIILILTDIIF